MALIRDTPENGLKSEETCHTRDCFDLYLGALYNVPRRSFRLKNGRRKSNLVHLFFVTNRFFCYCLNYGLEPDRRKMGTTVARNKVLSALVPAVVNVYRLGLQNETMTNNRGCR